VKEIKILYLPLQDIGIKVYLPIVV
jgi:hypothetical protein